MDDLYRLYDYRGTRPAQMLLVDNIFDPVTGELRVSRQDFFIPGPIPLSLLSTWQSMALFNGQIGKGWIDNWNIFVLPKLEHMHLHLPTGEIVAFETPWSGGQSSHPVVKDWKLEFLNDRPTFQVPGGFFYEFGLSDGQRLYLRRIYNQIGDELRFKRTAYGDLKQVIRSDGVSVRVECSDINFDRILGPDPETGQEVELATYRYNPAGQLIYSRGVDSGEWAYVYTEDGRLSQSVRPNEACEAFLYDGLGRLTTRRMTHGMMALDCAYPREDLTVIRRGGEQLVSFELNPEVRAISGIEFADKTRLEFARDELGRVVSVEASNRKPVSYDYDSEWGLLHGVKCEEANVLKFERDELGGLREASLLGLTWEFSYADNGELLSATSPEGDVEVFPLNQEHRSGGKPTAYDLRHGAEAACSMLGTYLERPAFQHPHWIGQRADKLAPAYEMLSWVSCVSQCAAEALQFPFGFLGQKAPISLGLPNDPFRAVGHLMLSAMFGASDDRFNPQCAFAYGAWVYPFQTNSVPANCVDGELQSDKNGRDKLGRLISNADQTIRFSFLSDGTLASVEDECGNEAAVVSENKIAFAGHCHVEVHERGDESSLRLTPWNAGTVDHASQAIEAKSRRTLGQAESEISLPDDKILKRTFNGRLCTEQIWSDGSCAKTLRQVEGKLEWENQAGHWKVSDQEIFLNDVQIAEIVQGEGKSEFRHTSGDTILLTHSATAAELCRVETANGEGFRTSRVGDDVEIEGSSGTERLVFKRDEISFVEKGSVGGLMVEGRTDRFRLKWEGQVADVVRTGNLTRVDLDRNAIEVNTILRDDRLPAETVLLLGGKEVLRFNYIWSLGRRLKAVELKPVISGFFQNDRSGRLPIKTDYEFLPCGTLANLRTSDAKQRNSDLGFLWSSGKRQVAISCSTTTGAEDWATFGAQDGQILINADGIKFSSTCAKGLPKFDAVSKRDMALNMIEQKLRFGAMFQLFSSVPVINDLFPFENILPKASFPLYAELM